MNLNFDLRVALNEKSEDQVIDGYDGYLYQMEFHLRFVEILLSRGGPCFILIV